MKLNLGCSDDHKAGYVNVDQAPPADQVVDLNQRWPWEDSSVDEIFAHDVFEHLWPIQTLSFGDGLRITDNVGDAIKKPYAFTARCQESGKTWAMNEAHRVLKPGGVLDLAVPCVMLADGRVNPGAFADPTHATFWTFDDRYYFGEEWNSPADERGRLGPAYGITALFSGQWRLVEYGSGLERRSKVQAILKAVK